MSVAHLLNQMRLQAQMAGQDRAAPRLCLVTSYDPNNYCAKVLVQPENTESGWLPVTSLWVGNGWGIFAPPSPNDMVQVQFQEDDFKSGYICMGFFNDEDRPLPVPSGELWLQHKSGAFFKLQNDGSGTFSDGHGATIRLNGDGTITSAASKWTHTGDVTVVGNTIFTGQIHANGKRINDTHTHGGVASGGSQTSSVS